MMSDEKQLIEALKKNDSQAFQKLVNLYHEKIHAISYGFLRNKEDAEDITQEVFIEIHKNIHFFREESNLSTWIHRITINRSLNLIKKNKIKNLIDSFEQLILFNKKEPNSESDPHQQLTQKEVAKQVQNAINKLPKNQNIAFTLHKYNNLSYTQIADIMETSLSAVESLIHRAKNNLKISLKDLNKQ